MFGLRTNNGLFLKNTKKARWYLHFHGAFKSMYRYVLFKGMPFGRAPVLEVDGTKIAGSINILRFLGRKFGKIFVVIHFTHAWPVSLCVNTRMYCTQTSQLGSSFNRETWRLKPIFFPQPIYPHATLHPRRVSPHSWGLKKYAQFIWACMHIYGFLKMH